jgi:hypothetical protein
VNQSCPVCGTQFKIGPGQVGTQFPCFKCGTSLTVTPAGIQAAGAAPPPPPPPLSAVPLSHDRAAAALPAVSAPAGPPWWRRVDVPTWLFGLGTFLVILYLFLPLINHGKARRARAKLSLGEAREKRAEEEFKKAHATGPASPTAAANRALAREAWAKDRAQLEAEVSDAHSEVALSNYWYTWGMMFGFMLLAGAALGYLSPSQPAIRRVVGAIILCGEILLIFLRYVTSVSLTDAVEQVSR